MNTLLFEKLIRLGLKKNEVLVYLSTLEMGEGSIMAISKACNLNRTTCYDILVRLCMSGIISRSVKNKKRIYFAESPFRLRYYLQGKKRQAEQRLEELEQCLPELKALHKTSTKPVIKFVEGKKAMEQMYYHKLDSKSTIYSVLNQRNVDTFGEMGAHQSIERYKRGIKEKVLAVENSKGVDWYKKIYGSNKKRRENTEYRWIKDSELYKTGGEISIFDDNVNVILSNPEENVAFEIQSQTFADFLKMLFEFSWLHGEKKHG